MTNSEQNFTILLSGGLDSTVALAKVINDYPNATFRALWVHYGQRHAMRELEAAETIASTYGIMLHKMVIVPGLKTWVSVPEGTYKDVDVVQTGLYVPARNFILIGLAASLTWPEGTVVLGAHELDTPYADAKMDFLEATNLAISTATYGKVKVIAPLIGMTKAEIIKLGAELGVPLQLTYSCYRGEKVHCGVCPACRQRKEAFQEAGVDDMTEYYE